MDNKIINSNCILIILSLIILTQVIFWCVCSLNVLDPPTVLKTEVTSSSYSLAFSVFMDTERR